MYKGQRQEHGWHHGGPPEREVRARLSGTGQGPRWLVAHESLEFVSAYWEVEGSIIEFRGWPPWQEGRYAWHHTLSRIRSPRVWFGYGCHG